MGQKKGYKQSEEHIKKRMVGCSKTWFKKGRTPTKEEREIFREVCIKRNLINNPMKDPKIVDKVRQKLKGRIRTIEERKKHSLSISKEKHWNYGKKHSKETIEKISKSHRGKTFMSGEAHWNWQGGKTPLQNIIRTNKKYLEWRSKVFKRDNYHCINCGKKSDGDLNADHIIPFSYILKVNNIKTLEQALKCKELWDIGNGRTLCIDCHKKTNSYGQKAKNFKLKIRRYT